MAVGDVSVSITRPDGRQCAKFDGVDDYVSFPLPYSWTDNLKGSYSAWFKANIEANNHWIMMTGSQRIDGYISTAGKIIVYYWLSDATSGTITNNTVYADGLWHQITVSKNATNINVYVDNTYIGTKATGLKLHDDLATGYLGSRTLGAGEWIEGTIRDVRIYNRELSENEVSKLYAGINITDGLVGYWPLKSDYLDYSGNGKNGTNYGSVLVTSDGPVAKAVKDARVNASDTIFAVDVANGTEVLTGRIQQA